MKKAFTLIELLIVMSILGILVGIMIPTFRGMQQEGWVVKAEAEIQTLQIAVESYYTHHNFKYPSSLEDLKGTSPQVIVSLPKDAFKTAKGGNYGYSIMTTSSSGAEYYVIYSVGINGRRDWVWDAGIGAVRVNEVDGDDIIVTNAQLQ